MEREVPDGRRHFFFLNLRFILLFAVKEDSAHTIGVEFGSRVINVGGKSIKLQIWDTVSD